MRNILIIMKGYYIYILQKEYINTKLKKNI